MKLRNLVLVVALVTVVLGSPIKPTKRMWIGRHRFNGNRRTHTKHSSNKKTQVKKQPGTKATRYKNTRSGSSSKTTSRFKKLLRLRSEESIFTMWEYSNKLANRNSQKQFFQDVLNLKVKVTRCRQKTCFNGECVAIRNTARERVGTTEYCNCKDSYTGEFCQYDLSGFHGLSPISKRKYENRLGRTQSTLAVPVIEMIGK